jgi:hypothetical protein
MQGYHFPPPEPDPNYGYGNQQPMPPPQWGQQADPHGYELSYQAYSAADPSPFANATPHQQQHSYGETEADYGEEFFEDEEPRRGRRWMLIVAALVGAIGVGGALAYTYRALVAPHGVRVPVLKADTNVKAKPDFPGKQAAVNERRLSTRDDSQQPADAEPRQDEAPAESVNQGPRIVRPIPIVPGGSAQAPPSPPTSAIPGITLYQAPQAPQPQPQVAAVPPAAQVPPTQTQPKVVQPPKAQQQPGRITIGTPPPAAEPDDEPSVAAPPVKRTTLKPPVEKPLREASASMGLGYVAVLSSKKSRMDALTEYADLRERYPTVLGDKTPDVQEADLTARNLGTMYRLVVGPPGSHNAASGVCAQLKAAGYVGCWVKEY